MCILQMVMNYDGKFTHCRQATESISQKYHYNNDDLKYDNRVN